MVSGCCPPGTTVKTFLKKATVAISFEEARFQEHEAAYNTQGNERPSMTTRNRQLSFKNMNKNINYSFCSSQLKNKVITVNPTIASLDP